MRRVSSSILGCNEALYRLGALVAALLLTACDVGVTTYGRSDNDGPPSVEAFTRFLDEGNSEAFVVDLNRVRGSDPDEDTLAFLLSIWRQVGAEGAPDLLRNELVLVELAATLAQASRNGLLELEEDSMHELIRLSATSENLDVQRSAAIGLSMFEDPADVPLLVRTASSADDMTYDTAIVALTRLCLPEAEAALDRIEPSLSRERRAFLAETRERYRDVCSMVRRQ